MKILNASVETDIQNGIPLKLNLGSGGGIKTGFYGLDIDNINNNVDIIADLNAPLDLLPDNSVSEVYTCHVLEHVNNLVGLMEELHRIVQPNGKIEIRVPHFSNPYYYSDPTHVKFFGIYSMYYFVSEENQPPVRKVPAFYTRSRFIVDSIEITLVNTAFIDRIIFPRLYTFINKSFDRQDFYERRLCRLFPANGLMYQLRVSKQ
jgi:SAM-dependent methyltransferase